MRLTVLLILLCFGFQLTNFAQIWTQDFETSGLGTAYTSVSVFTDNLNGHFNRTNGSNISNTTAPYSNKHGNFVWAGENLNITGGNGDGLPNKSITFAPINVTGQTGLQFRGLFGSGNPAAGWDYDDIVYVEYSMNGGAWTKILQFAAAAPQSNSGLFHDINLNGLGEGVALTPALQQFSVSIPVTGTSLQLRIYSSCTAQGEEFAFDYLRLYSTTTTIAGCTNPYATNFNPAATADNGSCTISGCTNSQALNFNATATVDDGSCVLSVPAIHLNEIHFNPNDYTGFTDLTHEFIELHNNTSAAVSIAGWRISGGVDCTFPIGASIPANGFILAAATPANYTGTGVNVYAYTDDLNNTGENIRLYTSANVLVDQVTYYSNCWPAAADGTGPSLELINYNFDNNVAASYCTGTQNNGTPGQVNSCYTNQIAGCTNVSATNYNPAATINDGSCIIEGCTYAQANNFNPAATSDDGSCIYDAPVGGCTYSGALNYNPAATSDDGSCIFGNGIAGCTYSEALNFDASATIDDGSCEFVTIVAGCTNSSANNFNPLANFDNGTCVYAQLTPGCTYSGALNYNPLATLDDGNCQFSQTVPGCTNSTALNYNPDATFDDGSCTYPIVVLGCTYPSADNYNPNANMDDMSCIFSTGGTSGCTYASATNYNASATTDDGSCTFTAPPSACPEDIDGNLSVGVSDLLLFIAAYGTTCN